MEPVHSVAVQSDEHIAVNTKRLYALAETVSNRNMAFTRPRRLASLPARLTLLVAGSILPLAAVAALTTYVLSTTYDAATEDRLLRLSQSALGVLEGRIQALVTAEQVLSVSQALQDGDLQGFAANAKEYLQRFMPLASIVVSDLNNMQVVNTSSADPLAQRPNRSPRVVEAHRRAIATGQPQFTALFRGQVIAQYAISIEVPVQRNGRVAYIIGMPVTSQTLSELLAQQQFDPRWTVAVWDRSGAVVARVPDWQSYVGRSAAPSIYPAIIDAHDQVVATTTFDGSRVLTAVAHSQQTGLTLAIGIPRNLLFAPRQQALFFIIGFSVLCLLTSGYAAARLAHSLLGAARTRDLLIAELNHRVGNLLSTVQGISQQTIRVSHDKSEAGKSIQDRIMALARAHRLLTEENWKTAGLRDVLQGALEPFLENAGRIVLVGSDDIRVAPKIAQALTLAMNELATNAVKYGALSTPDGKVKIDWERGGPRRVTVVWTESDGPEVRPPTRKGFGSVLLSRGLAVELGGEVAVDYRPAGVVCVLRCETQD